MSQRTVWCAFGGRQGHPVIQGPAAPSFPLSVGDAPQPTQVGVALLDHESSHLVQDGLENL